MKERIDLKAIDAGIQRISEELYKKYTDSETTYDTGVLFGGSRTSSLLRELNHLLDIKKRLIEKS